VGGGDGRKKEFYDCGGLTDEGGEKEKNGPTNQKKTEN